MCNGDIDKKNKPDIYFIQKALDQKLEEGHSKHHRNALILAFKRINQASNDHTINATSIEKVLSMYNNHTSYNTVRRNMNILFMTAAKFGLMHNPLEGIKRKKEKAKLNRAIDKPRELLEEIKAFNNNLYLCCLLTYGCLLRPHREVRELKWKDFDRNLTFIGLSGERNKSGRNRIVPIPIYVKEALVRGNDEWNIFSGTKDPFDPDYFKCLWSRFKKRSMLLTENQTLYSFRHTGAISIYKKTGSLEKLKSAMGHSNILVSMTYLRGLDIPELKEEDMPILTT